MYASYFDPFSGHHQAYQYKNLMNENVQKFLVVERHMDSLVSRYFEVMILHKGSAKIQARLHSYLSLPF
jgi:hypothetical protein